MINLKKHDNVADAVNEILQQEALKGNQNKIDANHNGKIDGEDFKILRGKKKVEEELKGNQKKIDKNHNGKIDGQDFKILRGEKKVEEEIDMDDRTKDTLVGREKTKQKDDVGPNSNAKVSKFKLKSEEAEQIDEKNVPTSPEKWAQAKSAAKSKFAVYPSAYANGWASKKYKSMGGGWKATSEEVEQIDELSKDTLGSYLDKKKSEYMKGKTQSGSKENAKDIQNMGKAHDKMNKEEVESLEEKNWIAGAIKKPGAETAAAKKAGMSVQAYAEKHKHDSGKAGKRARLAITLKHMKEKFEEPILDELINEVMAKDASAGDWIHDFVHSDNPKFAGKSKAKRKEMALAAYYSKKNEEAVNEGLKDMAKKTFKALTGGSDKDHLDRLKKDMYGGSEVKYAAKTLVKHAKDPLGLKKEEVEQAEAESLIENFEMISEVSLGAKIKAYASHSSDAFEHGDMGNDEESEHHNARAEKIHAHILKHHGVEAANHAEKAATSAIFGNGKHKSIDSLSGGLRGQHSKSVTKSGKIPKNTQSAMKNSVKGSYGKRIVGPKGHLPEEVEEVEENWDDMVKAAQEKVKSGPKPSGGSGKKEGSRYGGSKQKDKPEQEDVKEAKNPMMDAGVGAEPNFSTDAAKPMKVAQTMAKKSLAKMRSDMMGKSGK